MPHREHRYPSVTQVLGTLAKQHLYRWYGKYGWDQCERIKRESAEHGTRIHELISEYLIKGWDQSSGQASNEVRIFANDYARSLLTPVEVEPEEPYESEKYKFSGTFDWVDTDGKKYFINDLKTNKAIYPEMELQLAAYAQLWNEKHKDKPINEGKIWRLDKETGKLQIKEYTNLKEAFKVFKALLLVYKWAHE